MRTTLTIDDDVLAVVKSLAVNQHTSVGKMISILVRQALQSQQKQGGASRNGIPLLPVRSDSLGVTPDLVNKLRDELP